MVCGEQRTPCRCPTPGGHLRARRTALVFPRRPVVGFSTGISEVSRFSGMELLDVRGVYNYAGPARTSRNRR